MSPNPAIISQSPEAEVDKSLWKVALIALFGIAAAYFTVYFFDQLILTVTPRTFWLTLFFSFAFVILKILDVFLIKGRMKLLAMTFLEAVAALAVFYDRLLPNPSLWLIAGAGLFFVCTAAAVDRGVRDLANNLKIRFWPIAREVLGLAVTGLLILLTAVLYQNYFVWGHFNDKLGQELVSGILTSADPVLAFQYPGVSFGDNVHDFFNNLAAAQLQKMNFNVLEQPTGGVMPNFSSLSPAAKETLIAQTAARFKAVAEKTLGPLDDNAPVDVVAYQAIKGYVGHLSPNAAFFLALAAVVLVFFTLKGFIALFYWLIILLAFILFKFLIVVDFAYVNLETRSREFVMLN